MICQSSLKQKVKDVHKKWGSSIIAKVCKNMHAYKMLLSIHREMSLDITIRIQFKRIECTHLAVVWNCRLVCLAFRWLFSAGK